MGLIVLDGGPLDGNAYDTKDLLGVPESALPRGYVWTSERRTSPRTGKTAQVWRYAGDLLDGTPPPEQTPGVTAPTLPPDADTPPPSDPTPVGTDGDVVGPAPVDPAEDPPVDPPVGGAQLRVRRKAVKVSAGRLAELAGLKSSRVYAIETGSGKPVTDDEHAALVAALTALEAEASAH